MINQLRHPVQRCASICLLGIAVGAVCLLHATSEGMASGKGKGLTCGNRTEIKNYLSHLEAVAPVHSVPESGTLPFAPRGISLRRIDSGPKVGRGVIGFALYDEAINRPRRLGWIVKATLVKVSTDGKTLGIVARKTERIGTRKVEYETVTGQRFVVSGSPAYYRLDLHFEKVGGQKLGSYSEYFRVMKARYQAIMTVSDSDVVSGQMIQARIENLGTEPIKAELRVDLESYDGMQWSRLTSVYPGGKVFEGRTVVSGGETGPCFTFKVPDSQAGTRLRVTEEIRRYFKGVQRRRVSAKFLVTK